MAVTRPIDELMQKIEGFKAELLQVIASDSNFDMSKFALLCQQFRQVLTAQEGKRDFPISDKMFKNLEECEKKIEAATLKYKDDLAAYELKKEDFNREIARINSQILTLQGDEAIDILKHSAQIEYFQGEMEVQINRLNRSIQSQNCCFRMFSCCASQDLVEQEDRLDRLQADYRRLGSKDPNVVSNILRDKYREQLDAIDKN
jgi:hypothetical protein